MTSSEYLLVIDQGTTSSRVALFDRNARMAAMAQAEFPQHYPHPGWVEHDAEQIWQDVCMLIERAMAQLPGRRAVIRAIGMTNQRETTVLWRRDTGQVLGPAIVWQDRRTADFCQEHRERENWLHQKTGLVLDPYFSATKMRWLLEHAAGDLPPDRLALGTIDSFLIWRLTGGNRHVTDRTNASRTLLLSLQTATWDEELCRFFAVPRNLLPDVLPSTADFGSTRGLAVLPDGIPICAVAGDQQASLLGQGGWEAGRAKCTFGTGAFLLLHTGGQCVHSRARLLTTLAAGFDESLQYAIEGSLFAAGAVVQWLRDELKLVEHAAQIDALASKATAGSPVLFVPALVGLGAPHWVAEAAGTIFGITRGTTAADLARAALEGVALQVHDLIEAIAVDFPERLHSMRVDGGMARSDFFIQLLADLLAIPVDRVQQTESTALGVALLAGYASGWWQDREALESLVSIDRRFLPSLDQTARSQVITRWKNAVQSTIQYYRSLGESRSCS
ncbi:MAG: glycerol kinase [Pirellulaceae bacterium]|nr:MAG: glycerol kinase [Pirellulaceae bacterium]